MKLGSLFAGVGGFDLGFERAGFDTAWAVEIDEKAQAVLRLRFPDATLHDDVCAVGAHNLTQIDVLTFGSPCFPAGTLVLCKRGLLPIEQVVVGDEVVSHLGRWQRVLRIGSKTAPTRLLKGQGHHGLVTTDEHPFYASRVTKPWDNEKRRKVRNFSDMEWIEAKDLKGCMWSSLLNYPACNIPPMVTEGRETAVPAMTPELMWVIGAWVGDGWVRDTPRPGRKNSNWGNVIICAGYGAKADRLRQRMTDAGLTFCESNEKTTVRFNVTSGAWARWLTEHFARYSYGKTIPAWMFGAPEDLRRSFLDGYISTDGHRYEKSYQVTTVSKFLAVGVSMLIRQTLRLSTTMALSPPRKEAFIEGRKINERPQYCVLAHDTARSSVEKDGYRLGLVRSSEPTGRTEEVFNIEVEGDNSYTADGIIVHNCQDLSVAGRRAGLAGARSGLFHEATRIIRELRDAHGSPRFAIWENVPGAFSSNDGEDFACVLEEMAKLGARDIAWRVLDSRYHRVAQRRRRVFLVADFGGERAAEVLSLAEGLRGDSAPRRKARKGAPADARAGAAGGLRVDGTGGGDQRNRE